MKLYGKDNIKSRLDEMAEHGRIPHALMFSGHAGSGRRTLARYAAELILCGAAPDESSPTCRNIENNAHPDVIFAKRECRDEKTKEEKYAVKPLRKVIADTAVLPNNGSFKVYVFEDCDSMTTQHYNMLLKLIEEPAAHLKFIFTCENTGIIPETVMSRVTGFEVPDASVEDCERCLIDFGIPSVRARELAQTFSGNIGKCKEAFGGEENVTSAAALKAATALGKRDAFGFAAALSEQTVRADFSLVTEQLSEILREALSVSAGAEAEGFGKKEAEKIAAAWREEQILNMLDAAFEISKNDIYNINLALAGAYFTSRVFAGE